MEELNENTKKILDKLYNLRSNDSVILNQIDEEKRQALETKKKTSVLKEELEFKITSLVKEENDLANEGQKLKEVLDTISNDNFASVIDHLDLDFNPDKLKKAVEDKLPETLEKVASEKEDTGNKLEAVKDEMNDSIIRIEELGIKKDEVLSDQARLNKIFELSLSSNTSLTRDEITTLLAKMNFNDEEQRIAAKLIMFPEDGLFEYDKISKDRSIIYKESLKKDIKLDDKNENTSVKVNKRLSFKSKEDILEETHIEPLEVKETKEEVNDISPIIEFDEPIIEPEISNFEPFNNSEPIIIETPEEIINELEDIKVEIQDNTEITKEKLIEKLTKLGFDCLNFTNNDIDKMLENFDENLFVENIKVFDENHINKDIFADNVELLYDNEVKEKIKTLISVGKNGKDIYLNPDILMKYNLSELNNAIDTLKNSGLEPKSVPLMAY